MPDPKVCAACGTPAVDADASDDIFVCDACLGLHDQLAPPEPEPEPPAPEPVARRVVEEPPSPAANSPQLPAALPPLQNGLRWREIADGYRDLRFAMLTLLLAVPLSLGVRLVEAYMSPPRRGYGEDPLEFMTIGALVFFVLVFVALVRFLYGAVALGKQRGDESEGGSWLLLSVSAFIPVVNVTFFPLLLFDYTRAVGIEIGKRSVVRSAWVMLACSVVLAVPILFAVLAVLKWALYPAPTQPVREPPDLVPFEVLFGVGAGGILWLGAYVVTIMILSGVPRAIEKRLREYATPDDLVPDLEVVTDATP